MLLLPNQSRYLDSLRGAAFRSPFRYGRALSNAYIADDTPDIGADLFARGLCLPSDNKMTPDQQDVLNDINYHCFQ